MMKVLAKGAMMSISRRCIITIQNKELFLTQVRVRNSSLKLEKMVNKVDTKIKKKFETEYRRLVLNIWVDQKMNSI